MRHWQNILGALVLTLAVVLGLGAVVKWHAVMVLDGTTPVDTGLVRWAGTGGTQVETGLATSDSAGNINIPSGTHYKVNGTSLAYGDVGAAATNHSAPWSTVTETPTTTLGYGITQLPWHQLTETPTSCVGYGITALPWHLITETPTTVLGYGITNAVAGPSSATDGHLAVYDSTTGKLIKDGGAVPTAGDSLDMLLFGDGSDGVLNVTAGTSTLARDMQYTNLTISGTGAIDTAGFRVAVSGTLTLDNAPANAITWVVATGGGNASGTGAGAAGAQVSSANKRIGGASPGYIGKTGGTGAGTNGSNQTTTVITGAIAKGGDGGVGGTGGNAGANSGGTGGTTVSISSVATNLYEPIGTLPLYDSGLGLTIGASGGSAVNYVGGGVGGSSGGSGAGDGTAGGGSGGSGSGGICVGVWARTISRGAGTAAGCISAIGGVGGAGGSPVAGNRGGGSGGGGGGGGVVVLVVRTLTGAQKTAAIVATGGAGGAGAAGTGTGTAGTGGYGGNGGNIWIWNVGAGTCTKTAGSAGSAPTGTTGGPGGACSVNL